MKSNSITNFQKLGSIMNDCIEILAPIVTVIIILFLICLSVYGVVWLYFFIKNKFYIKKANIDGRLQELVNKDNEINQKYSDLFRREAHIDQKQKNLDALLKKLESKVSS